MRNGLKIAGVLLIMAAILLTGCKKEKETVSDGDKQITEEMDTVISDYIIDKYSSSSYMETEKQFEVHKVYGTSESEGVTTVYMWSFFGGFNRSGGLKEQTGHSLPAVIKLSKKEGGYEVTDYKEPFDGSEYSTSLKKLFPEKYIKRIHQDTGNIGDLQQEMDKKVKQWLDT